MNDTNTITLTIDTGYRLTRALQETISALHRHGREEQAAVLRRATAFFTGGRTVVEVGALHRWWVILQHAYHQLAASPIDEPGIADDTADLASLIIWQELRDAGFDWRGKAHWGGLNGAVAHDCTKDDLNADLNLAYEILAGLPPLADSEIEARVHHFAAFLDHLTYDTCADCHDDDDVTGDDLAGRAPRTIGSMKYREPLSVEIGVTGGVTRFAIETSRMWFPKHMLEEGDTAIRVTAKELANEGLRERVISLVGNTPGLADRIVDMVTDRGINPRHTGISLFIQRDDAAVRGYADPYNNACKMRDMLIEFERQMPCAA